MSAGRDVLGASPPGTIRVRITSLEMLREPSPAKPIALRDDARIERVFRPTVAFYRFLYDAVGGPWLWHERRRWSDAKIARTVQDPNVEVWVLSVGGQPAGYAELDRRISHEVELAYFGLMADFIGRGLGPCLLRFAIRQAWTASPKRLWVHTCGLDHPAALELYEREGFVPFDITDQTILDPRQPAV